VHGVIGLEQAASVAAAANRRTAGFGESKRVHRSGVTLPKDTPIRPAGRPEVPERPAGYAYCNCKPAAGRLTIASARGRIASIAKRYLDSRAGINEKS